MKIKLTNSELKICEWIAKNRYQNNRADNIVDKKIGPQSCKSTDLDGICGEFAFCKAFNLYPDMTIQPRSGGHDLICMNKKIDVKTTRYKTGRLLATKDKNIDDSDVYFLVISDSPNYTIAGWCESKTLIKDDNLVDLGYGLTYAMDQSELFSPQNFLGSR